MNPPVTKVYPPWLHRPYHLISWHEMTKFSAAYFMDASEYLAHIEDALDEAEPRTTPNRRPIGTSRRIAHAIKTKGLGKLETRLNLFLPQLRTACEHLGLSHIVRTITFMEERRLTSIEAAKLEIRRLRDDLESEMKQNLFLFVDSRDAKLFEGDEPLFGEQVHENFYSASRDIEEAGKCYALERYDACIFHSMRVLEHGLRAMVERLTGKTAGNPSWGAMIITIESEIRTRDTAGSRSAQWQRGREFFIAGALHFRYLKDAWRNYATHATHEHYDRAKATPVFEHVRDFMQHLATKVKERR